MDEEVNKVVDEISKFSGNDEGSDICDKNLSDILYKESQEPAVVFTILWQLTFIMISTKSIFFGGKPTTLWYRIGGITSSSGHFLSLRLLELETMPIRFIYLQNMS